MIERRPLGNTGLDVSVLALGTWAFSGDPSQWGHVDDNESIATVHRAIDAGINLIDTAPSYGAGHSEDIVGKALLGRDLDVLVATRCGLIPPERPGLRPRRCLSAESIERECRQSLRRLRREVIDLYICHAPAPETPLDETMGTLISLREKGSIRAIGVSNFDVEQLAAAREYARIDAVEAELSLINRRATDNLIPYCREYGIAVLACAPLYRGLLTAKFSPEPVFTDFRATDPGFLGDRFRRNRRLARRLADLAEGRGHTAAQSAIRWVLQLPGVLAVVSGAKRPSQVDENLGALGWELTDAEHEYMTALLGDDAREA
jgi:aryl-alcohol dehydrogenase-like predicted oxidoreductase